LINTMTLPWFHSICKTMTKTCKKHTAPQVCATLHDRNIRKDRKGRGVDSGVHVMLQVQTCSSCNHSVSSMPQPNTNIVPNKPVTLLCNHLFLCNLVISAFHPVTVQCYVTW
jgi:hypothetical protein